MYRYINVAAYFGRGGGGLAFLPAIRGGGAVKYKRRKQCQQNELGDTNNTSDAFYVRFTYVFPSLYRSAVWVEAAFLFSHRCWVWLVGVGVLSWLLVLEVVL